MNDSLFTSRQSSRLEVPIVVSVPHAGLSIPEIRKELMMLGEGVFYRDVDFEIHQMWERVCDERDLSFIKSEVHRYAIDLNRRSDQDTLIWKASTRQEPLAPFGRTFVSPSAETVKELVEKIWKPYYVFIEQELQRVRERFGFAILLDGHSMPSKGTAFHADPGGRRAEIVPGDFNGKACHPKIVEAVEECARGLGFSVSRNQPYGGGNITQHFGRPHEKIHALQIEINRCVYIENEEAEKKTLIPAGIEKLRNLARSVVEILHSRRDLFLR